MRIDYGIFGEDLETQVNKEGCTLGKKAEQLEKIRKAINMVGFHVATESQVKSMLTKLNKKVVEAMVKIEKGE